MNEKKICFITCVTDKIIYEESVLYMKQLKIPADMQVEFIEIYNPESVAQAYNQAMQQSDAKYKIYLHQDIYIINKNFIFDILNIFKNHEKIGLIGMTGMDKIPTNACWWMVSSKYNYIYDSSTGTMSLHGKDILQDLVEVAAIDGILMAAQYDLPWSEDAFTGWWFSDMSQSVEFIKQGYKVVIPQQGKPWCIHDCGPVDIDSEYEKYRNVFLDCYSTYLFPLVSILIPTYNRPEYFKIAFESALQQSYRNIEVIVCDNSTNEETAKIMEPYLKNPRVRYVRNRHIKTKKGNFQAFKNITKGKYINWLMDDDILHTDKINYMMQIYREHEDVSLVTSYRQWIDAAGNPIPCTTKFVCEKSTIFDGREIGKRMLLRMENFIGEPTTVLIKRDLLKHHYWNADCRGYEAISDVVMWLELLEKGKMAYITEPLSSFRRHIEQEQAGVNSVLLSRVEWFDLVSEACTQGYFIENIQEYKTALLLLLKDSVDLQKFVDLNKEQVDVAMHQRYTQVISQAVKNIKENKCDIL